MRTVGAAAIAAAMLVGAAIAGDAASSPRPVIGKPTGTPSAPALGKRFTAVFKVTRSDTGKPLTAGSATSTATVGAAAIAHTTSFRGGTARVALLVPASAGGKQLRIALTVTSGGRSATSRATFRIAAGMPGISVTDAAVTEGNSGASSLTFAVSLSQPATGAVSVQYATTDGTASSPADYTATSGTLSFKPGERTKSIVVPVTADVVIEEDETLSLTLTGPTGATIARGTASGRIANDDLVSPVTAGSYKGATQDGNFVFFTVLGDRTITGFRINDLSCPCEPYGILRGGENYGKSIFHLDASGALNVQDQWTGSETYGDTVWTGTSIKLLGRFDTPTTVSGTILVTYDLIADGTHYHCSSGEIRWTATLQ